MQEAHNKSICLLLLYIFKVIPTKPWCGSNTATKKKKTTQNPTCVCLCIIDIALSMPLYNIM